MAGRATASGGPARNVDSGGSGGAAADASGNGGLLDEDGFQRVVRRGARKTAQAGATGGDVGEGETAAMGGDGGDMGTTEDGNKPRDELDGEGQPTSADLQQAWLDEVAVVRRLRQQGLHGEHPAMRAACTARDAAEQAWRASKDPAPASVRLGRAQSKLDRAIALQAEARQAMLDAEREHRVRMEGLQAVMDECNERVRGRRAQLKEVQAEVGGGGDAGGTCTAQQQALRQVHSTICGEVGPTIAALVEQLDSSTPAWATLNGLLGKLSTFKEVLESAGGAAPAAQAYDIGDSTDHWEGWSEWSESHEVDGPPGGRGSAQAHGGWGSGGQGSDEDGQDQTMGTGEWWDGPARRWKAGARWQACGHGKWARSSWADQLEEEGDESGDADLQPASTRRRLEPRGEETGAQVVRQSLQGAQLAQQRQQPPAEEDAEERRRKHDARVDQIVAMAIEAGVNPIAEGGLELQLLDPHKLDAWVAEHLPAALLCSALGPCLPRWAPGGWSVARFHQPVSAASFPGHYPFLPRARRRGWMVWGAPPSWASWG